MMVRFSKYVEIDGLVLKLLASSCGNWWRRHSCSSPFEHLFFLFGSISQHGFLFSLIPSPFFPNILVELMLFKKNHHFMISYRCFVRRIPSPSQDILLNRPFTIRLMISLIHLLPSTFSIENAKSKRKGVAGVNRWKTKRRDERQPTVIQEYIHKYRSKNVKFLYFFSIHYWSSDLLGADDTGKESSDCANVSLTSPPYVTDGGTGNVIGGGKGATGTGKG